MALVAVVLIASAGVRLWHLSTPPGHMFDEVYYAKDAKAVADGRVQPKQPYPWMAGDEVSWPHPELGKWAIAAGILLFGDRSFGWRIPAVVAGMVLLACVYPIARRLGLSPPWAFLALLFAAADPLGMAQSRIATLDIFVALWTVLCVYLALRYVQSEGRLVWLFACGAAGGVALSTKWSGALALVAAGCIILVAWLWRRRAGAADEGDPAAPAAPVAAALTTASEPASPAAARPRGAARALALVLAALIVVPAVIYLLGYAQYFAAGHTLADWRELQRQMYVFNLNLDATHSYASTAPTWIFVYRPVWYYFNDAGGMYRGVVAIGNPFLWWLSAAALVAAPALALARRSALLLPPAALVAVLYFPWFLASRTSFLYYMTPVAPFLAILVAAAAAYLAGGRRVSRRAWLTVAGAAFATAVVWEPVVRAVLALGWASLAPALPAALALAAVLLLPRLRALRPWATMALAGAVVGIVVAFIPVVLATPISPEHFSHITWFTSWI